MRMFTRFTPISKAVLKCKEIKRGGENIQTQSDFILFLFQI